MSFFVSITDGDGNIIKVSVSLEVYKCFEDEQKNLERLRKEMQRHRSLIRIEDEKINKLFIGQMLSVEEKAVQNQLIAGVLNIVENCTKKQRRRFYLNRILGYSLTEIAKNEGCSEAAVRKSIEEVIKKIKKNSK